MSDTQEVMNEIREAEVGLLKAKKRLVALRKSLAKVPIDDYVFSGEEGSVTISELFGEHSDLIVVHNMGKGCPYCTLWADGFVSSHDHLQNRAAFVISSPDTVAMQQDFAESRGWPFTMVSCVENSFPQDMGFWHAEQGAQPGVSVFSKDADGKIFRDGAANFGPGDDFCSVWSFFDLLKDGPNGWTPQYEY